MKTSFLAGMALVMLATNTLAAKLLITVGAQESVPPKYIFEPNQARGICPDIFRALEKRDADLQFVEVPRPRSMLLIERGLEVGQIGVACALLESPRRLAIATKLPTPVYKIREQIAGRVGDTEDITSIAQLRDRRHVVTTYRGGGYADPLRVQGVQVDDESSDALASLRKVIGGRARYFYMNDLTLAHLIAEHGLQRELRVLPTVFNERPMWFWVSRQLPASTVDRLARGLNQLQSSGELERIYQKYRNP